MPSPPLISRLFFQPLHSRESAFPMDHLFDAQARAKRILTGEVFNLVQHGCAWIKSAIMPQHDCLLMTAPAAQPRDEGAGAAGAMTMSAAPLSGRAVPRN